MTMFMNCTCSKACTMGVVRSSLNVSTEVEQSCTDNSAVIAGGVGGVMTLIIVSQSVIILILLLRQKKATNSQKRFVTLVLDDFLLTACSHYTQSLLW